MMSWLRFALAAGLGFLQALVLAVLLAWICRTQVAFLAVLLPGWPWLVWRELETPSVHPDRQSLLRSAVLPLAALPLVSSLPLLAYLCSLPGYSGNLAALVALGALACLLVFCWGMALLALLASLEASGEA